MTHNAKKYGLMIIVAVLFVTAFAGAASAADPIVIDSQDTFNNIFGDNKKLTTDGYYKFKGDWELSPTNIGGGKFYLTIDSNVILDFSEFTGTFAGMETTKNINTFGCLFGSVKIGVEKTLEIKNLNITSAKIISSARNGAKMFGGIIGVAGIVPSLEETATATLKFTDCTLENCKISITCTSGEIIGGLIGQVTDRIYLNVKRCTLNHCELGSLKGNNIGGMAGKLTGFIASSISDCTIMNSIIYGNTYVGGIVGAGRVINFEGCNIKNTIIYSMNDNTNTYVMAGGLLGGGTAFKNKAKVTAVGCEVTNSLVGAKGKMVGGLFGNSAFDYDRDATIDGCSVRKSTIVGSSKIGGLVGIVAACNILFKGANKVENSAVRGTNSDTDTNLVIGSGSYEGPYPIADVNKNFLNNNSQSDIITLYDINGDVINPGDASFIYTVFNATGQKTANGKETEVTHLGTYATTRGYGIVSKYQVIYDGNGATSGSAADNTGYDKDAAVTVKGNGDLAKTGHTFAGWNTQKNGKGTAYVSGAQITMTAKDITLYAQWTPDVYDITYLDVGGFAFNGTQIDPPLTHTYGTTTTLKTPVRSEYIFGGWFKDEAGTAGPITQIGGTDYTADFTVYAKWTLPPRTIEVLKEGEGIAYASPTSGVAGTTVALSQQAASGYEFKEWKILSGDIVIKDNTFTIGSTDVVIKAVFQERGIEPIKLGTISGTITWPSDEIPTSAVVRLLPSTAYLELTPGQTGSSTYTFEDVEPGVYNVEISYTFADGTVRTANILADNSQYPYTVSGVNLVLPKKTIDSKVVTEGKATEIEVKAGGVTEEAIAQAGKQGQKVETLTVTLVIKEGEEKESIVKDIKKFNPTVSENVQPLDAEVIMVVNSQAPEYLSETETVLELYVPFDQTGKENIQVFRTHGDTTLPMDKLDERPATTKGMDGNYFIGADGVYMYSQYFSAFTVAYSEGTSNHGHSPSLSNDYTPSGSVPVMVQETVQPTAAPTPTPAAPTVMPTTKPTATTSKSPAPVAGLIAGLGAAGLVLSRLRK